MMDYQLTVKVNLDDLCELVRDSITLNRLYEAGVDNWEGWEYVDGVSDDEVDEYIDSLIIR